jgi:hypothetical protein
VLGFEAPALPGQLALDVFHGALALIELLPLGDGEGELGAGLALALLRRRDLGLQLLLALSRLLLARSDLLLALGQLRLVQPASLFLIEVRKPSCELRPHLDQLALACPHALNPLAKLALRAIPGSDVHSVRAIVAPAPAIAALALAALIAPCQGDREALGLLRGMVRRLRPKIVPRHA